MAGLTPLLLGLVSLLAFSNSVQVELVQVALEAEAERVCHRRHARQRRGLGEMITAGEYG